MADEEGAAAPEPEPEPEPEEMPPPIGMAWTDLSPEDVDIYVSTKDLDEKLKYVVQELVMQFLGVEEYDDDRKTEVFVDFMLQALDFGEDRSFDAAKLSAWFTIMLSAFQGLSGGGLPRDEGYTAFKKLVMQHSVEEPPDSVQLFDIEDVRAITAYATEGFFRHYKLYEMIYFRKEEEDIEEVDAVVETPLKPRPLAQARVVESKTSNGEAAAKLAEEAAAAEEAKLAEEAAAAQAAAAAADADALQMSWDALADPRLEARR
eukprot:g2484.t1